MMFKKYVVKLSNTLGTVNYLSKKSKENKLSKNSSGGGGGCDVVDCCKVDYVNIDDLKVYSEPTPSPSPPSLSSSKCDLMTKRTNSRSGSSGSSDEDQEMSEEELIIVTAIQQLRNTLLFYTLVFFLMIFSANFFRIYLLLSLEWNFRLNFNPRIELIRISVEMTSDYYVYWK